MIQYTLPNGQILTGGPFTLGDVNYPANWLELAGHDDMAALGIGKLETADAITSAMVDTERDRRLMTFAFQGRVYDFADSKGSEQNISNAAMQALGAIMLGAQPGDLNWADPSYGFVWISHNNETVPMDAETCQAFGVAAQAWKRNHILAARVLKNTSPIPENYADPSWWPA